MIRGDAAEESLCRRAEALVAARGIESESNLGPLFETSSPDDDPEVLKRLRQIYEACGWVLLESNRGDRKSTRLNSSHEWISYAVFCLKKKKKTNQNKKHRCHHRSSPSCGRRCIQA